MCFRPGHALRPCLHTPRRTQCGKQLWVYEHCYVLCTRRFKLCHALCVDLLLLCFVNDAAHSRAPTI